VNLPEHIRIRKCGPLTFAFNYGKKSWNTPKGSKIVLGTPTVMPQSLSAWKR
jgi:beta-galactosidase